MLFDHPPVLGLALALTTDARPCATLARRPDSEYVAALAARTQLPEPDLARRLGVRQHHLRLWTRGSSSMRYYNLWALQMLAAQADLGYLHQPAPAPSAQPGPDGSPTPLILLEDPWRFEHVLNVLIDAGLPCAEHPHHDGSVETFRQHLDDLTVDPAGHTVHLTVAGMHPDLQTALPGPCLTLYQLAAVVGASDKSLRTWATTPAKGLTSMQAGSCAAPRSLQLLLLLLSRMRLFGLLEAVTGPEVGAQRGSGPGSLGTAGRALVHRRMLPVQRVALERRIQPAPSTRPRVDAAQDHVTLPAYYSALLELIGAPIEQVAACLGVSTASVYNWTKPGNAAVPRYANQVALETLAAATLIEQAGGTGDVHAIAWRRVIHTRDKALEAARYPVEPTTEPTTEPTAGEDPDVLAIAQALQQARAGLDLI